MTEKKMTPAQRIKLHILLDAIAHGAIEAKAAEPITADNVDELFRESNDDWQLQDFISEFRSSGVEAPDIKAPWSRHYESAAVARLLDDGLWVGWTYWYGGGKHGEPEAVDWIDDAYDLELVEQKRVVVNVFKKVEVTE